MVMNLHELRILCAVVEHRSFSRGAAAARLTQPAVSQAIRRLEEEAGAPLLTRARPPELTAAGERVHRHALDVLARDRAVRRDLASLARGGPGLLSLGASQALSREPLPALLGGFLAEAPRAALAVETLPSRQLVRAVADRRLELGLGPFQRSMAGLVTHRLGVQDMVLFGGRAMPGLAAARRARAPVEGWVLVTSHLDEPSARPGNARLRERFSAVWEVQSLDLRMDLIAAGRAVGYLPASTVAASPFARSLRPIDWLGFGRIRREVGLFHADRADLSPVAAAFLAFAARA